MSDHPPLHPPADGLIAQVSSELDLALHKSGWSFTVGNDPVSTNELAAADGFLPMLLWHVQSWMASSGRDLRAWDRMTYRTGQQAALCAAVPVPGNPTYSASDWVRLVMGWLEGEGAAAGRIQSLDPHFRKWGQVIPFLNEGGRRLKGQREPAARGSRAPKPAATEPKEAGHGVVRLALEAGLMKAARFLLERGEDVDEADPNGFTALHWSAQRGDMPSLRMLIEHGARVDALTRTRQTPALLAAAGDHLEAFQALVEAGANLTAIDVGRVAGPKVQAFLERRGR